MQVHVDRGGERFGPYSLEEVNAYLAQGTLLPTDKAWQEGMADWGWVGQIPGVVMPGVVAAPSTPPSPDVGLACPQCQAPVEASQVICMGCGTQLQGEPESRSQNVDEENTIRLLRKALFRSPWGAVKGFFRDLKEYYRTIFKQIRHPAFSVKEGQGIYFSDMDLVKMSVSLYVTIVLIGLAIVELGFAGSGDEIGNIAMALLNVVGILVFFVSIWCAVWIGRVWVKWAKPSFSRRQIDKMFVYESCLIFALALPLILTKNGYVILVCWVLAFFHPFYMFLRINKVQATNILVRLVIGGMLALGASFTFCFQATIGMVTAGENFVEESINEPILAENIVGTYENSGIRIKFLENGTTEVYNSNTKDESEGEWKVNGSEVFVLDSSGGQETILVFRVKLNGDLIYSASMSDEGRQEASIDEQFIFEKIE